jgi:hypothetical protein
MNKKLYELHEQYEKHNYDGTPFTTVWRGMPDIVQPCTCGGCFRTFGYDETDKPEYFDFENVRPEYVAQLMRTVPAAMRADLRRFLRKIHPSALRGLSKITEKQIAQYRDKNHDDQT